MSYPFVRSFLLNHGISVLLLMTDAWDSHVDHVILFSIRIRAKVSVLQESASQLCFGASGKTARWRDLMWKKRFYTLLFDLNADISLLKIYPSTPLQYSIVTTPLLLCKALNSLAHNTTFLALLFNRKVLNILLIRRISTRPIPSTLPIAAVKRSTKAVRDIDDNSNKLVRKPRLKRKAS